MHNAIGILPLAFFASVVVQPIQGFSILGTRTPNRLDYSYVNRIEGGAIASAFSSSSRFSKDAGLSAEVDEQAPSSPSSSSWAKRALLISSFSDGVLASPDAQDFLRSSLVASMMAECQHLAEKAVSDSVVASPCNGPDIEALTALQDIDAKALALETGGGNGGGDDESTQTILSSINRYLQENDKTMHVRVLYIPTAMYALRSDSKNTPGKQRQRARADGKKKRAQVVNHIKSLLGNDIEVLTVTLDFDDGSIKQPAGSEDESLFPKDGKEALQCWAPHLIYVEGGNTFWLHHCMTKGSWKSELLNSCCERADWAVYCGKSAGAIIAGSRVETATWKGWDDPSVVTGMEEYSDWKSVSSLDIAGGDSFFPHMNEDWESLVVEKRGELEDSFVHTLREEEACCVDGHKKQSVVVRGIAPNE